MAGERLDGLLLSHLPDVRYLCGFSGSNGMAVLLPKRGYFLTDFRYREQSAEEVKGLRTLLYDTGLEEVLLLALHEREGMKLGFDPSSLTYGEALALRRWLKGTARLVPVRGSLAMLRSRKSPAEVEILRRGLRLAQDLLSVGADTDGVARLGGRIHGAGDQGT